MTPSCPVCHADAPRRRCPCGLTLEVQNGKVVRARSKGRVVWSLRSNAQLELEARIGECKPQPWRSDEAHIPAQWFGGFQS